MFTTSGAPPAVVWLHSTLPEAILIETAAPLFGVGKTRLFWLWRVGPLRYEGWIRHYFRFYSGSTKLPGPPLEKGISYSRELRFYEGTAGKVDPSIKQPMFLQRYLVKNHDICLLLLGVAARDKKLIAES